MRLAPSLVHQLVPAVSDALTSGIHRIRRQVRRPDFESELSGVGLTYTVTPEMKVSITQNDFTGKGIS